MVCLVGAQDRPAYALLGVVVAVLRDGLIRVLVSCDGACVCLLAACSQAAVCFSGKRGLGSALLRVLCEAGQVHLGGWARGGLTVCGGSVG